MPTNQPTLIACVGGIAQVMRKYMNYSSASRREVTQPEVVSFVMQKSDHLASGIGDMAIFVVS